MSMKTFTPGTTTTIIKVRDNTPTLHIMDHSEERSRVVTTNGCGQGLKGVQVLFDFCYKTEFGRKVCMNRGERFHLIKKTNNDWWQVKRVHEKVRRVESKRILPSKGRRKSSNNNSLSSEYLDESSEDSDGSDRLNFPFYAPANYLREIGVIDVPSAPESPEGGEEDADSFCHSVNLSSEFSCDSAEDADSGNQDDTEISSNNAATSSRESLIEDSNQPKDSCDIESNCGNESKSERLNGERAESPIVYVNLPLTASVKKSPPVPIPGNSPVRILLDHWAEYVDLSGRKYYYNSVTRDSSWKPPRGGGRRPSFRDEDPITSHSEENLTDSSTTSLSRSPRSCRSNDTLGFGASLNSRITKPKTRPRKAISSQQYSPPTLTKGWTRHLNEDTKEIYFVSDYSKGKWFCKLDENGRLYFYEENGKESYWELPDIGSNDAEPELREKSRSLDETERKSDDTTCDTKAPTGSRGASKSKRTIPLPVLPPTNRFLAVDRQIKARSMAYLPTSERQANSPNIPAILLKQGFIKPSAHQIAYHPSEPPATLEEAKANKTGILSRTKLTDAGRRLRKNWAPGLIALSDDYLLLFKESKCLLNNSNKPEMVIELVGALVDWSPEKSSRKNVFRVTTVLGHQVLLQDECALICKEWFDAIKSAILKLPSPLEATLEPKDSEYMKDCKLKRSKSTKQFRKCDNNTEREVVVATNTVLANIPQEKKKKIRERLMQFLRRRPTLETLREKGIFQDEPVFGCNLSNLCQREKQIVPKFVKQCIQAIEQKDLKADGIYRVCGNLSQVQKLRIQVNHDNYSGLWSEEDVHVLTGILKMFFRDMKEPLFPCSQFDALMECIGLPDRKSKLQALVKLVKELPLHNQETLKFLLQHLLRVKEFVDENRMHIQNLAIVFGPTLMWPESETNNFAYDMMLRMHQNQIIEFLLLEFENIFR